jgi:hypothetical protein
MSTNSKETQQKISSKKDSNPITFQSLLKEILEFQGWEIIFQVLLYGFIAWGTYGLYHIYLFHHDPTFAEVPKFSIYDLKISLIPALFFFGYKRFCLWILHPWIKRGLDPVKYPTEESRVIRATKGSIWLGDIVYYICSSILNFMLFKNEFFFPGYLGGPGECTDLYKYTPYVPHIPYGVLYYQIQFGWHFHKLIDHVVYKWSDPSFWEMFLHHFVAVFLVFFSFLTNQLPVGLLVFMTHDPCDIFLYSNRFYHDRKDKKNFIHAIIYLLFVFVWVYLRLFVFPKCVVGQAFYTLQAFLNDKLYPIYLYMILMMSALVCLHLYWFVYIVRIMIGLVLGKKEANYYDGRKDKVDKKN